MDFMILILITPLKEVQGKPKAKSVNENHITCPKICLKNPKFSHFRSSMESFNGKVWAGVDYTEGLWSQRSLMRKFKNKDVTLFKSNTIIQKVSIQECTNYE